MERRIFFVRRLRLKKFNPYRKPCEPSKPVKPKKTIFGGNREKCIRIYDYDITELNGTYESNFYDDGMNLYPVEEIDNPHYDIQLKKYDLDVKKYEKDLVKYKEDLKEWNASKKIWDAQQKEKELAAKRKQLERLKKELGET